jgi:glycine cleavage system H protein
MKFSSSHEWAVLKGKVATIGISDFAQKELGEVVYVELPAVGRVLKAGEEASVLESTKAAADTYTPVSGKVIAINEAVAKDPSLINRSAEKEGWLFKVEIRDSKELDRLLSKDAYLELVQN